MAKNFFGGLFGKKKTDEPPAENERSATHKQDRRDEERRDEAATGATTDAADDRWSGEPARDVPRDGDKLDQETPALTDADRNVAPPVAGSTDDTEAGASVFLREVPGDVPGDVPDGPDSQQAPESPFRAETAPDPVPEAPASENAAPEAEKKQGFFARLKTGLSRSSDKLTEGVASIFTKRKLDDETLEELEDLLITADLGVAAAAQVTDRLAKDRFDKEISHDDVRKALAGVVADILAPLEAPLRIDESRKPHVILMTGVNGAGKTTTIGKLAAKFRDDGLSVMLAAGDTFRAAAIEQLTVWGERTGAPVISRPAGADAAGLAFDALKEAKAHNVDVLLIDTAGRLQNRRELMDELGKIVRVIKKIDDTAPHDTILVLDATVGQNAVSQAAAFQEIAGVSGLIMTKLDGTARGGVLVALSEKFALPIHYVGVGEGIDDMQEFDAQKFALALAGDEAA